MDDTVTSQPQFYVKNGVCFREEAQVVQLDHSKECKLIGGYLIEETSFLKKTISVRLQKLIFRCGFCDHSSVKLTHMKQHIAKVHDHSANRSRRQCIYLSASFSNMHECIVVSFDSEQCNFNCFVACHLNPRAISADNRGRAFKCEECNYSALQLCHWKEHTLNVHHIKTRPFKCPQCEYTATLSQVLEGHIMSVHKMEKRFKCDQCSVATSYICSLKLHIRCIHNKVKPYNCDQYNYNTSHTHALKGHISSIHKQKQSFKCKQCSYVASRLDKLKAHNKSVHS